MRKRISAPAENAWMDEASHRVLDALPGLAAMLGPDGSVAFANAHLLAYSGRTLGELRGWLDNGFAHADDCAQLAGTLHRAASTGAPFGLEVRLRRHDGTYQWQKLRASPARDEAGTLVCWYLLLTDIDDLKRAEEALRLREVVLTQAQRLASTGSLLWKVSTGELTWSDELYRICELEPGSVTDGRPLRQMVHPDDLALFDATVGRALTGEEACCDFRILTRSGVKYLHSSAQALKGIMDVQVLVGAVQDITAGRQAEDALARARAQLAHVSRVTTFGTLTASIAHEVNQPLSGIITNAATCLRMLDVHPPNVEGARETARRTLRDGRRAGDVVTRLRALFGNKETPLGTVDLNDATREVVTLSLPELQARCVALQLELSANLPPVRGDRVQLQQVLLNLLRNGSEAMAAVEPSSRRLLVRTTRDGAESVRLTVRDQGIGLAPEDLPRLFQAFHTTKPDGMGIGLSVSRSIIERHEGRLWAEANEGAGASFAFSLPVAA